MLFKDITDCDVEDASPGEMLLDRDGDNSDEELNHDDTDIYQTLFPTFL